MISSSVLIANRGEVAIRIARACAELGIRSVAVHTPDDASSLHVRRADTAHALQTDGPEGYLDVQAIIAAAKSTGCNAIHPGYGFLSESAMLARACEAAGLTFIGPSSMVLELFGDKVSARTAAAACGIATPRGIGGPASIEQLREFFKSLPPGGAMIIKAVTGGGGRGMRVVRQSGEIEEARERCQAEAQVSFGQPDVYAEELIDDARHIEVQVLGDGTGQVTAFGERECSFQRRHQKIMEIAPSPSLDAATRKGIVEAALRLAAQVKYRGLCTFEFLVDRSNTSRFVFIEANPRLQVEHTVTEATYDVDLVQAQLRICLGANLAELALAQKDVAGPRGYAMQLRVNMETMREDGSALPAGGTIETYEMPSGPGVRIDGFGYAGYKTSSNYDSLLAKIIVHSPSNDYATLLVRARRAVDESRVSGVATNLGFLAAILAHPDVTSNQISTRWLDLHTPDLVRAASEHVARQQRIRSGLEFTAQVEPSRENGLAPGLVAVFAPMQGSVVSLDIKPGDILHAGQQIAVLDAMKMQHVVVSESAGMVREVMIALGDLVANGALLIVLEPTQEGLSSTQGARALDLDEIRADLAESIKRHAMTLDDARPEAVKRRHNLGNRTARENIADLVDPGSFVEYGALAIAAQRNRHSVEHLRQISPADGLVGGLATVNAVLFGPEIARTVVVAYDYMVFAGTQGTLNHKKQDRLFRLAADLRRPLILFAEGGGGRPGDTDKSLVRVASLDQPTFKAFANLSGLVPVVGVANGRCFAGNAALLGCCDVIIATKCANIGLGGPAMIEGGGLGIFSPEQIGPSDVQTANGVIDVLVDDEEQAVQVAKKYLSYFQGRLSSWKQSDQRKLRHLVPENRLRSYDVRSIVESICDSDSVLELREQFAKAMVTALGRIAGRPVGIIGNNPLHLGGAIDASAADKAARFIQLCEAHDIPLVSLCDTPGFMVGPEAEKTAQVRHVSRMFVNTATRTVPLFLLVLRKSYGLGALAMSGGNFGDTTFSVSWPSGEFGGMGLEGAVRLAYRKELEAIADKAERKKEFDRRVSELYQHGKANNVASVFEIDDVIDPAETRDWIIAGLESAPKVEQRSNRKRSHVETW